jgi:hypothetical protein
MAVYADWAIELMLDGSNWTDVSADVVGKVSVRYGILANGPLDRVAGAGQMIFQLDNSASNSGGKLGYYSPGHINCRSGFQAGIKVRLVFSYQGVPYGKFHGRIPAGGIDVKPGVYKGRRVEVTVADWMEQAAIHRMYLPSIETSKRMSEVVPLIVANMPITPLATDYNQTESTFETAFDTVRNKTTAISEMAKLALSELGYIYVKRDQTNGETLVTDGRFERSNTTSLTQVAVGIDKLLCEDGSFLLQETGDHLIFDGEVVDATINKPVSGGYRNPWVNMEVSHGKQLFNDIRYTSYPTYVDAAATTVLFSLNSTIEIAPGITKSNVLGRYRDPTGGAASVSGKDMVVPAATTDYLFNTAADGSGTDITANLTVTASYGTEGVNYSLENTHATLTGYVIKLQARGKGIYTYDPMTLMLEDAASKVIHGTRILNLDLKYERNIETAYNFASVHLNQYKDPQTAVETVEFVANHDGYAMATFLGCDIGSKFSLYDDLSAVNGDYFINGIEFAIMPGKVIYCTWYPSSAANDVYVYWYLGEAGKSELGVTTFLGF